jgi:hypothetical protein
MKLRLNVIDKGELLEVESICENEKIEIFEPGIIYEIFSWEIFEKIIKSLQDGLKVFIPKNLIGELKLENLIIEETDKVNTLDRAKRIAQIKMRDVISNTRLTVDKISFMDLYEFFMIGMWFAEKGFFITEDNKEEKYIEILEYATSEEVSNSNEYIAKLDKFLSVMNSINENKEHYDSYLRFVEELNEATTEQEIENVYNTFKSNFY